MYEAFDKAVRIVLGTLKSDSHKRANRHYFKLLREHLVKNGVPYSHQAALDWLSANKGSWKEWKFSCCRTAAYKLNDVITSGGIQTAPCQYPYEDAPKYARLSPWSRQLLDNCLEKSLYSGNGRNSFRIASAEFLLFAESIGVTGPEAVSPEYLAPYIHFMDREWADDKTRKSRIRYVCVFLSMLMGAEVSRALSGSCINIDAIRMDSFTDTQRAAILDAAKAAGAQVAAATDLYSRVKEESGYMEKYGYSANTCRRYRSVWTTFFLFLSFNGLDYSPQVAEAWCKATGITLTGDMGQVLLGEHENHPLADPAKKHAPLEDSLPAWSRRLLIQYLSAEKACGKQTGTIETEKYACIKFLLYLEEVGIASCGEITPDVLKNFNFRDLHRTPEGKKSYNSRIRRFLEYLGGQDMVPATLFLALPCKIAASRKIVRVLADDEISRLYAAKDSARTSIELRDSAIVFLGLRMGLRAGDITSLKLRDIDWDRQTVSIIQSKTGKPLHIPMPTEVGNCIYRYFRHGRPDSESGFVFLSQKVPHSRLKSSACSAALNRMLSPSGKASYKHGFHITRRTFASRMLESGQRVDDIVDLLGHDGNHTVMSYLATDGSKMRMCGIPAAKVVDRHD